MGKLIVSGLIVVGLVVWVLVMVACGLAGSYALGLWPKPPNGLQHWIRWLLGEHRGTPNGHNPISG
jgi:hypothetical protein